MRKSNEDFQKEALEKNHKVIVLGEYTKQTEKILVKCLECGNEFYVLPRNVLAGHGCRKCADKKNSENYKMPEDEFKKRIYNLNPNLMIKGKYIRNNIPIECKCMVCNNVFYPRPSNLLNRNATCPRCSRKALVKTQEDFIVDVKKVNPQIKILGKYVNNTTRIECECLKCGEHWSPKATWLLQGKGCPKCNSSKGERRIESFLLDNGIKFIKQYTYEDCKDISKLPFDFFLPDYNLIIEYDGKQHFKEVDDWFNSTLQEIQRHDEIKNQYCKNNNINILRIPYWDYKNIESILNENLLNHS